jgi:uncharacterized protein
MYDKRIFEFDIKKSQLNKIKHGIDFNETQEIWDGPHVEFLAKDLEELRYAIIGTIKDRIYTCIFTMRGKKIRLISCRRSRSKERQLYEESIT